MASTMLTVTSVPLELLELELEDELDELELLEEDDDEGGVEDDELELDTSSELKPLRGRPELLDAP